MTIRGTGMTPMNSMKSSVMMIGRWACAMALVITVVFVRPAYAEAFPKADGYQGIWYANEPTKDEYVYKYSGGLGSYCMKHIPMALYAPKANKTFFVFGGVAPGGKSLLEMVGCYDHATGLLAKPTILMDKKTTDAHDNPVISMDDGGYLWVFCSSHGTARPSFLFKSRKPYDIDDFEQVWETNFSYPQPWYIEGKGFLFLHTRYAKGRGLFSSTSPDGIHWSEPVSYAHIEEGHYQVSWPFGDRVGTAFDHHPQGKGLNFRTNLYYMQTGDMGATWKNAAGEPVQTPVTSSTGNALVHDYAAEKLLVYVKDLNYTPSGQPAILYVTSRGWQPGPENGPHTWCVARWTGDQWAIATVAVSDNNYDSGSLYVEGDRKWRIIGPTEPGPQPFNPGGEVAVWTSNDGGATWSKSRQVTQNSRYNHTHVRRPLNAHPDFYAFWADGDTRQPSESQFYFCDQSGKHVFRMPVHMDGDWASPEPCTDK